jgi:YHS domain-containing protein
MKCKVKFHKEYKVVIPGDIEVRDFNGNLVNTIKVPPSTFTYNVGKEYTFSSKKAAKEFVSDKTDYCSIV